MINKHIIALIFSISAMGNVFGSTLQQDIEQLKKEIRENQAMSVDSICYGTLGGLLLGFVGACCEVAITTTSKKPGIFTITGPLLGFLPGAIMANLARESLLNRPLVEKINRLKKIHFSAAASIITNSVTTATH